MKRVQLWVNTIYFISFEFSKLYLEVKAKITALFDVSLTFSSTNYIWDQRGKERYGKVSSYTGMEFYFKWKSLNLEIPFETLTFRNYLHIWLVDKIMWFISYLNIHVKGKHW